MFLLGNQKAGKADNGQMTQQSTQAVRSSLIVLFIQIVTNCNDFSDGLAYFNKQCLSSVKMEIPRHVIFASYWLSLKSSQSSIEATEYVEGNVGDIYFSFGNVVSFFFLPATLLDGKQFLQQRGFPLLCTSLLRDPCSKNQDCARESIFL